MWISGCRSCSSRSIGARAWSQKFLPWSADGPAKFAAVRGAASAKLFAASSTCSAAASRSWPAGVKRYPACLVEQRIADRPFERGDAARDRGLADAQGAARGKRASFARDGEEIAKVVPVASRPFCIIAEHLRNIVAAAGRKLGLIGRSHSKQEATMSAIKIIVTSALITAAVIKGIPAFARVRPSTERQHRPRRRLRFVDRSRPALARPPSCPSCERGLWHGCRRRSHRAE